MSIKLCLKISNIASHFTKVDMDGLQYVTLISVVVQKMCLSIT